MVDYLGDLRVLDISGEWQLTGWRQNDWQLALTPERSKVQEPDVGPVPAAIPGSVRTALLAAGVISDPTHAAQSRLSEWLEHRHWIFSRELPAQAGEWVGAHPRDRLLLECDGLDYAGFVLVDETVVGEFRGSFLPYHFDLTAAVESGGRRLRIVFTDLPANLGQNGWTSRIREWKSRFSYGWDWTPRMVQIGITASPRLRLTTGVDLRHARIVTTYSAHSGEGALTVDTEGCGLRAGTRVHVGILGPGVDVHAEADAAGRVTIPVTPRPWHVRPRDDQSLYRVEVTAIEEGQVVDRREVQVGFRELEWQTTHDAPGGADRWLCVVNGRPLFLAGINWVPIRPDHGDVTAEEYRSRLTEYRDMGMTVVRVWGGAGIEADVFYDLCDELGLLVWQELPLSSSGLDNEPPTDTQFARQLSHIAVSYAVRLRHRPSLALWCGGNELTRVTAPAVPGPPLDDSHPALMSAGKALADADPGRRYIATSPTGPRFDADPAEFGNGLHHDVHGPWEWDGTEEEWTQYWRNDDAILRSEVGVAGASDLTLLEEKGLAPAMERSGLRSLWTHSSGWWLHTFDTAAIDQPLSDWVEESQLRQRRMLHTAAEATLARFPASAGFLVWLGHDTFPCAVSLSLLDWHGTPKPAALGLRTLFAENPHCRSAP